MPLYYPHERAVTYRVEGEPALRWQATIGLGKEGPEGIGARHTLLAVRADARATQVLDGYQAEAKATGRWPGMEDLPEGAIVHQSIIVQRK